MRNLEFWVRNVVWAAVFATVLTIASIAIAIFVPNSLSITVPLGLGAVVSAILSHREQ
jgi:hypothetical protein